MGLSKSRKEQFIKELEHLLRVKWPKQIVVTKKEKLQQFLLTYLSSFFSYIYTGSSEIIMEKWALKFKELLKRDLERRIKTEGIERQKIDCWIAMHKLEINAVTENIEFQKITPLIKLNKKLFLAKFNFDSGLSYYKQLKKQLKIMKSLGEHLREKAEIQKKLIGLIEKQYKSEPIKYKGAMLTDIITMILTDNRIPIATSVKIILRFGISGFIQTWETVMQTKKLDEMATKFGLWDKIMQKDVRMLQKIISV